MKLQDLKDLYIARIGGRHIIVTAVAYVRDGERDIAQSCSLKVAVAMGTILSISIVKGRFSMNRPIYSPVASGRI